MAQEIELKLSLTPTQVQALCADERLGPPQHSQFLYNQYFDTPDLALNKAACALRIRKTATGFVQTLKTKGIAVGGLHQRGEWEVPIAAEQLEWDAFPADIQPDATLKNRIQALFTTNFQRHLWNVRHGSSAIEMVLDEGHIRYAEHNINLCEVELELKEGDAADLFRFARELCQRYSLVPCDINKAERGYRLIVPQLSFYRPLQVAHYTGSAELMAALLQDGLTRISRRWDQFCSSRDWWHLAVLLRQLQGLNALSKAVPGMPAADSVIVQVQPLFQRLQVCLGLFVDTTSNNRGLSQRLLKQQEHALYAQLAQVLGQNALGNYLLDMGEFLYQTGTRLNVQQVPQLLQQLAQDWQQNDNAQALAFIFNSLNDPRYATLNAWINQACVVQAMADVNEFSRLVNDAESRAILASWQRRLTVEQRTLQERQGQMSALNKESIWPRM